MINFHVYHLGKKKKKKFYSFGHFGTAPQHTDFLQLTTALGLAFLKHLKSINGLKTRKHNHGFKFVFSRLLSCF